MAWKMPRGHRTAELFRDAPTCSARRGVCAGGWCLGESLIRGIKQAGCWPRSSFPGGGRAQGLEGGRSIRDANKGCSP